MPRNLRALNLKLFTLPSNFDRLAPRKPRPSGRGGFTFYEFIKVDEQKLCSLP
jgi:hypothetical protein